MDSRKERERLNADLRAVLRAARDQAGLTQEQLAKRLGWKKRTVVSLEHGTKAIHAVDIVMIGRACGIQNSETLFRRWLRWGERN